MTKGIIHNKDITLLSLREVGEDIAKHGYGDLDGYNGSRKQFAFYQEPYVAPILTQ